MQVPVQIITFGAPKNGHPQLKLTNEGISLFSQIKEKQLSVVTIAGP